MINKIYKRIHNKYSTLFKFIFFLRYLFGIFFVVLVLFLLIPNFFDYKKKDQIIKNYLLESYGLQLNSYKDIDFHSLPTPSLEILNASINLSSTSVKLDIQSFIIYPRLINIYNTKNFSARKIILNNIKSSLQTVEFKTLSKFLYKLNNRLTLNNLELKVFIEKEFLIKLKKINFSNYGYNKNSIIGEVFDRKFKVLTDENLKKINFSLLNTGVDIDVNLDELKKDFPLKGTVKAKLLNSNIKFDFNYDDEKLKIKNSYFRNKELSFNNETIITHFPFFNINTNFDIEDINTKLLKNLNLNKILDSKNIIKKINSKNKIHYKIKKFRRHLIDELKINIDLAHGRLVYSKNLSISKNLFNCQGDTNLLDEFPILYFNCSIISKNKKELLKKFLIKYETENELFSLNFKGNLNLLNNKINFNSITIDKDFEASKEDLKYFKEKFEKIVFNENFINIFSLDKIKNFILEVT